MAKRFLVSAALIAVILGALAGCGNRPPEIVGVSASPNPVEPNLNTDITCTVSDADGDLINYEWYSVFDDTTYTASSFTWKAPNQEDSFTFTLTVSDGQGGVDSTSLLVIVQYTGIPAVTILPPIDIGTRQATIMWTSADQSWMGYQLYRSTVPDVQIWGSLVVTYNYANGHTRLDTTYTDTDLQPGTDYYYAVQVVDSAGNEAFSTEIMLTTTGFEYVGNKQSLGGGHGVRLANKGLYIFCAALEQAVKIFTIGSGGLDAGPAIGHPDGDNSAWAYDLVVVGNLLHVAFGKGGYRSYDITNPFNPIDSTFLDALTLGGEARAVYALGSAIFVGCTDPATATHTLVYFDYTNPGALFIDTLYNIPEDIHVTNNYIYVAEGNAGMEILSWNPTAVDPMQHVSIFTTYDEAHRIYLHNNYAYIAASTQGFVVVDVSNPTSPTQASQWPPPEKNIPTDAQGIWTSGNIVYVADGPYGLRVLDLTKPLWPEHLGTKDITDDVGAYKLMDVVIRSEGTSTQAILADWNNAIHMIEW